MIVVTGATGQLGREIVEQLLTRVPPDQVGVSVRAPEKAAAFADRGVRVRHGDFTNPATLRDAFEGASQVLVISSNTAGKSAVEQHRDAIDAAVAVGARRILYTSHMGSSADSAFAPMRDHAATEVMLGRSGVPFTSLRNGFYTESALQFLGTAFESGEIDLPADGQVSWTARADLAEAAAIALTEEGRLDGITPPLTASQSIDFDDIAGIATEVTGRQITRKVTSDDEFRRMGLSRGMPETQVQMSLGLFAASRAGEFSAVDPTLEALLDRPPRTFREILAESRATQAQ